MGIWIISSCYFSLSFYSSSSLSFSPLSEICYSSLIYSYVFIFDFDNLIDFSDAISLLVPSLITSFSTAGSSTSYTTTAFSISLRLISFQEGLLLGVRLKHLLINSSIPTEKYDLLSVGFLVGSKAGSYLVITLWRIKPKDQISIFSKSSLNKF